MKTIGMIGGMSWESSQEYYRIINEKTKEIMGGLHSAKSLLFSFDFHEIEELQAKGNWAQLTTMMIDAARQLQSGGADFLLICTNTMHKMADDITAQVDLPLLHIADATAEQILSHGFSKVALLGTKFTMEQDFYKGRLQDKFGLEVIVPNEADCQIVHDVIYNELCVGDINDQSRQEYCRIIAELQAQGAEGVILGCTEIPLLIRQTDVELPIFDTTCIHAEAAVEFANR